MRQKFYLYIEEGVAEFDTLNQAMRVKNNLNNKGIRVRVRMRTPKRVTK